MFKDAIIIFKKEIKNIIKDKRTIFALFILPLILMPIIFSAIGITTSAQQKDAQETSYPLIIENNEDSRLNSILQKYLKFYSPVNLEDSENNIIVEFPKNYIPGERSEVNIYSNSNSNKSSFAARMAETALIEYEDVLSETLLAKYNLRLDDLNLIHLKSIDTAPKEAQGAGFLSMMIPYLLLIYIFAGSMNMALDTTAGEKERGSLAAVLVNQVSRTPIAIGKILYVIAASLLSSFTSFIGLIIAFSMNKGVFGGKEMANLSIFTPQAVIGLLVVILTLSGIAASLMILLGSLAKNIREGGGYILPIYISVIVVGVSTMQMDTSNNMLLFFIPVLNSVFAMKGILLSQYSLLNLAITVLVNLGLIAVFVALTGKLFNSEKIIYTI